MKKYSYDTEKFPFAKVVSDVLNLSSLVTLHEDYRACWELFKRETDQLTPFHPLYYSHFKEHIEPLWTEFVRDVILPQFSEDILYQAIPTFRVQIPNNTAVGEYHNDSKYGHQEGAVNVFLPFVNTNEYNTVYVESAPNNKDYNPMLCKYGEFFLWDGVRLTHGNVINESSESRVSVDARIIPVSIFKDTGKKSININTPFVEGGYYKRMEK